MDSSQLTVSSAWVVRLPIFDMPSVPSFSVLVRSFKFTGVYVLTISMCLTDKCAARHGVNWPVMIALSKFESENIPMTAFSPSTRVSSSSSHQLNLNVSNSWSMIFSREYLLSANPLNGWCFYIVCQFIDSLCKIVIRFNFSSVPAQLRHCCG